MGRGWFGRNGGSPAAAGAVGDGAHQAVDELPPAANERLAQRGRGRVNKRGGRRVGGETIERTRNGGPVTSERTREGLAHPIPGLVGHMITVYFFGL